MSFDDVYLVSDNLKVVTPESVWQAEQHLAMAFPPGYTAFVTTLGLGAYCGFVRVYLPDRVLAEYQWFQSFWREHTLWRPGTTGVTPGELSEAIILASTMNGDDVIVLPTRPHSFYVLPRHQDTMYAVGSSMEEALAWCCFSGMLQEPMSFPFFESGLDRGRLTLVNSSPCLQRDDLRAALRTQLRYDKLDQDTEGTYLRLFVKRFWGSVIYTELAEGD